MDNQRADDRGSNAAGNAGLATSLAPGVATITAELGGVTGQCVIAATQAVLARLELSPQSFTLPAGASTALAATATFSDGSFADVTAQAVWSSSVPAVASVDRGTVAAGVPGSR